MPGFREPVPQDWQLTVFYVALFGGAVILSALVLVPWMRPIGIILWGVLGLVGLLLLIEWHTRHFGYRCQACGYEFQITLGVDLVTPQGWGRGGWKYLKWPRCGHWTRARVLRRE
jgi:hypothetical protein